MIFFEKLKLRDVMYLMRTGQSAFYGTKSLGARFAERIAARLARHIDVTKIDFGHVAVATDIRKNAYKTAETCIDLMPGKGWSEELSRVLAIDFWLIVRKFFFDELYIKFEFIELALRFVAEHPQDVHLIKVDPEYLGGYREKLKQACTTRFARNTRALGMSSILLLPLFVEFFWRKKGETGELRYDRRIICEVDGEKTLEMFSSLFYSVPETQLAFVVEQRNAPGFSEKHHIEVLGLRRDGLRYLRRMVWRYIGCSLSHHREIAGFGNRLFRIFYILMQGRAEAVAGQGNIYCTYEHLVTIKAVRNEFLKAFGSKSVFVPMNAHVASQYFHSEILVNYDVMCAAGPHTEAMYRRKRACTKVFLPTGSYDSHRGVVGLESKEERLSRLLAFKGEALAITLLSPGICDPTYGQEVKLMALARTLSTVPGVRVFVRMKPVPPEPKYANFYREQAQHDPNILLTGAEFELFDFLEPTDLFITSISNSAFDFVQANAQVMFIDFLKDPDLMWPWSTVPGVLLPEDESMASIMAWVSNHRQERVVWADKMRQLAEQIAYQYPDFESYRHHFMSQIGLVAGDRVLTMDKEPA